MSTRAMADADEIRILAPTGVCGSGFSEQSFETALALRPHFIGCDAGSTDPGPEYLGTGRTAFPPEAIRRDLRLMLKGARRLGIPLLIGSCGTAGADTQVALVRGMAEEIAREEGLSFELAVIRSEQRKDKLQQRLQQQRILPLDPAPPFDAGVIERSEHIVGMMGAEPFIRALESGADVVLAGRSSDTAIFASVALMHGFPAGLAWHAAKILECGAAAATSRKSPDCMFVWLRRDHFLVAAPDPELRCTPQSIAAHALYENADPFRLVECSGTLDLTEARYEAVDARTVKVSGSRFEEAQRYTVKLEGAELAGYQSILVGSVRDPLIVGQIDDWLQRLRTKIDARVQMVFGDKLQGQWQLGIRVYGKNGTMGALEPVKQSQAHELGLVFELTARTQEIARSLAGITRHQALHLPIPQWSGLITAVALPYNALDRGPVYRFNMNQVVLPDDPYEMFPMERTRVVNAASSKEPAR
jgi:hypothetical protein